MAIAIIVNNELFSDSRIPALCLLQERENFHEEGVVFVVRELMWDLRADAFRAEFDTGFGVATGQGVVGKDEENVDVSDESAGSTVAGQLQQGQHIGR